MTDIPINPSSPESPHAWVHENLAAYLAGGLSAEERGRFDAHINTCAECFDAFAEARDADRALQRAFGALAADEKLEEKVITNFRETTMKRYVHPMIKKAGYAAAACLALAATGVFANYALHSDGRFNNALSRQLVADADEMAPDLNKKTSYAEGLLSGGWKKASGPAAANDGKKAQIPVFASAKPEDIPTTNDVRTQIIKLDNVDASRLKNDLKPLISADADVKVDASTNAIVVTDTAAKVHRLAEIIQGLDHPKAAKTIIEYKQLINTNAADASRLVNSLYASQNVGAGAGAVAGGGGPANTNSRVYADADARTNTVVLNGPPEQVASALQTLNQIESIPVDYLNTGTFTVKHLSNAQAGDVEPVLNSVLGASKPVARAGGVSGIGGGGLGGNSGGRGGTRGGGSGGASPTGGSNEPLYVIDGGNPNALLIVGSKEAVNKAVAKADELDRNLARDSVAQDYKSILQRGQLAMGTGVNSYNYSVHDKEMGEEKDKLLADDKIRGGGADAGYSSNRNESGFEFGSNVAHTFDDSMPAASAAAPAITPFDPAAPRSAVVAQTVAGSHALTQAGSGTLVLGAGAGTNFVPPATVTMGNTVVSSGGTLVRSNGMLSGDAGGNLPTAWGGLPPQQQPGQQGGQGQQNQSGRLVTQAAQTFEDKMDKVADSSEHLIPAQGATAEEARDVRRALTFNGNAVDLGNEVNKNSARAGAPKEVPFKPADTVGQVQQQTDLLRKADGLGGLIAQATPNQPRPAVTATQPAAGSAATKPGPSAPVVEAASALKIIRNGTMEYEVSSFVDASRTIERIAGEEGGFIASTTSDKLANGKVRGTIVVRVPPGENLKAFIDALRSLGDLKSQQFRAQDVTKEYTDTDSELRGLRTMEQRLLDLIKNGKGEVKDLVEAEKQLGEYRVRIEKLEGELRYYDNQVALCTITISLYEKDIQTPTAASEQEVVNTSIETEEVEAKFKAARAIFDDAKARIVESQMRNTDAEHAAAHIVADVPPDKADFVAGQLKQLGKVTSFNRDRRQTVAGGSGTPSPNVQVEHKDTRITVELFNLANLAPRETTVLRVAVRDVEATYKNVLGLVQKETDAAPAPAGAGAAGAGNDAGPHAVGRVIASSMNGQQPEQMSADIRAEVRAENADAVLSAIRASGEVLAGTIASNPDSGSTTTAKQGIQLTLVNIAAIPPKQNQTINIAVRDVEGAYNALLAAIRKDAPAPAAGANLLPATTGRVLASNLTGQRPEQMVADVRAEIRADQADAVVQAVRGGGEVLNSSVSEVPEASNSTLAKKGLQVHFVNVAAVDPREIQELHAVALDVPKAYNTLLASLQNLSKDGSVRVMWSDLSSANQRNVVGKVTFEARREAVGNVEKAIADAGLDVLPRNIVRSTDTATTLDSKVRYQIDEIRSADSLEPIRTLNLTEEVDDVDKALGDLVRAMPADSYHQVDYNVARDAAGRVTAHFVIDVPVAQVGMVQSAIGGLGGVEKNNQLTQNNSVPETRFARERVDLTLMSRASIVKADQGLGRTARAALSTASGALIYSLYLVLTGLLFVLPFVLILWPAWVVIRRRKAAT